MKSFVVCLHILFGYIMDNRKTGLSIIHGYIKAQAFSV